MQNGSVAVFFGDRLYGEDESRLRKNPAEIKMIFDPSGKGAFPADIRVIRSLPVLGEMLTHLGGNSDGVQLICGGGMDGLFGGAYAQIEETIRGAIDVRNIRFNTLVHRHELSVKGFINNFDKVHKYPFIQAAGPVLKDIPVFIVSAGPSLDRNGHLLKECRKRGVIFSMHSSAGAVAYHGAETDLLLCIEGMDTSGFVKNLTNVRQAALCLSANKNNYDTPFKKYIFCSGHAAFAQTAEMFGGKWFHYGSSVATAAFSLARVMGSTTLVLLGQDLAYTGGRVYAKGTGRENISVDITADTITRSDISEQTERYRAHGLKLSEAPRPRLNVRAWGGSGEVATTQDMIAFLRWFETVCAVHKNVRIINATEGGAGIEQTEEASLAEVLEGLPERDVGWEGVLENLRPTPLAQVTAVVRAQKLTAQNVVRKAGQALAAARTSQEERLRGELELLIRKAPMIPQLATAPLALAKEDKSLSVDKYHRVVYSALRAAAKTYMGML